MSSQWTHYRGKVAGLSRTREPDDPELLDARQAMRAMLMGTVDLLFASDIPREKALDLVPVRPLADHEGEITQILQKQLGGIYAKLTS